MADEAVELAIKALAPPTQLCTEAEYANKEAFHICSRLAFAQARIWELIADTLRYESPP